MIRITVMYPNTPGSRFDHDYFRDKHMGLVKEKLGDACLYYSVDRGLAGGAPGSPAPYHALAHILLDSPQALRDSFAPHAPALMADIPNYTDVQPTVQISDVSVERG